MEYNICSDCIYFGFDEISDDCWCNHPDDDHFYHVDLGVLACQDFKETIE